MAPLVLVMHIHPVWRSRSSRSVWLDIVWHIRARSLHSTICSAQARCFFQCVVDRCPPLSHNCRSGTFKSLVCLLDSENPRQQPQSSTSHDMCLRKPGPYLLKGFIVFVVAVLFGVRASKTKVVVMIGRGGSRCRVSRSRPYLFSTSSCRSQFPCSSPPLFHHKP